MSGALANVYLVRHGETAWAISGQHTGRTNIPLTEKRDHDAQALSVRLKGMSFGQVLTRGSSSGLLQEVYVDACARDDEHRC